MTKSARFLTVCLSGALTSLPLACLRGQAGELPNEAENSAPSVVPVAPPAGSSGWLPLQMTFDDGGEYQSQRYPLTVSFGQQEFEQDYRLPAQRASDFPVLVEEADEGLKALIVYNECLRSFDDRGFVWGLRRLTCRDACRDAYGLLKATWWGNRLFRAQKDAWGRGMSMVGFPLNDRLSLNRFMLNTRMMRLSGRISRMSLESGDKKVFAWSVPGQVVAMGTEYVPTMPLSDGLVDRDSRAKDLRNTRVGAVCSPQFAGSIKPVGQAQSQSASFDLTVIGDSPTPPDFERILQSAQEFLLKRSPKDMARSDGVIVGEKMVQLFKVGKFVYDTVKSRGLNLALAFITRQDLFPDLRRTSNSPENYTATLCTPKSAPKMPQKNWPDLKRGTALLPYLIPQACFRSSGHEWTQCFDSGEYRACMTFEHKTQALVLLYQSGYLYNTGYRKQAYSD